MIAGLVYPVMPDTATTMIDHLGLDSKDRFYKIERIKAWKTLTPGIQLPKTTTLFPRIEVKKKELEATMNDQAEALKIQIKQEITIDDFSGIDLRVATIIKAEAIVRAKKLLKLEVDMGEAAPRTLVAGIAESYQPNELAGKQVIVVANLKPAKLMGVRSQGMVLAASSDNETVILTLDQPVPPGTPVR